MFFPLREAIRAASLHGQDDFSARLDAAREKTPPELFKALGEVLIRVLPEAVYASASRGGCYVDMNGLVRAIGESGRQLTEIEVVAFHDVAVDLGLRVDLLFIPYPSFRIHFEK